MRSFRDTFPEQCYNILETISTMQSILKRPVTSGSSRRSGSAVGMKSEVDPDLDRADQIAARAEDDFVLNSDKGRAPNFTTAELTALLDLINNDYHFAHGHWDKAVDAETVPGAAQLLFRERWKDITHQINAIGGYDREWREVKRKLTTWMSKVKKKAADIHAHNILSSGKTGGRAAAAPWLTPLDERVFSLLNHEELKRETSPVSLLDAAVSCELADDGQTSCESLAGSSVNHVDGDIVASDDSAWTQRQYMCNSRNAWEHLQRVTDDTDAALCKINKSVNSLVEIGKKRMKLEERKLKVAEELVQVQKELNANILKLIQGKLNSG